MRYSTVILALAMCFACAMAEENEAALKAVSDSTGQFSTNFFKKVSQANAGKNIISSPLSAHIALSMTAYGAGGNTAKQMRESLHLPSDDALARQGFQGLLDNLNNVVNVTLEVANKVYVASGLNLKSDYKELTVGTFKSEAAEIDTSDAKGSAKAVNGWVNEKTHNKIPEIIQETDITGDTRLLLLNAVYFKGGWAQKFKVENTKDRTFHLDEKTQKEVPTMFTSGKFVYGQLHDLKASFVELPYENKNLKMVIIVPDEINGLSSIVENLDSFNQSRLYKSGYEREVQLYLPKFKIESTLNLESVLEELGMTDMFNNNANFTGVSDEPLKVSKVLQKAFIEVNEEGSEAAAATETDIDIRFGEDEPENMIIDRPYMYLIVKENTNNTIFAGRIVDPTATE